MSDDYPLLPLIVQFFAIAIGMNVIWYVLPPQPLYAQTWRVIFIRLTWAVLYGCGVIALTALWVSRI